ncbi:MAG: hypothetical protein LC751_18180 [Actinobacteria bacterium]|nr:hypothetical protein [Actinomycetota bacterium]
MAISVPRLLVCFPENPADGSLRSEESWTSPISISSRGLQRSRGAIPREPSSGKHSRAILGPISVIQNTYLDDTDKGREAFSKIKALLKKAAARTKEALVETMAAALAAVTPKDARGWFYHSGYEIRDRPL